MRITLIVVLAAATGLCSAAEPSFSKQFVACMEASGGITASMLDCIATETRAQDAMLNATYKAALKKTPKPRQSKLQEAQRNWLKFRDSNCRFYLDPDGGTNADVVAADCVLTMTESRERELQAFAE